MNATPERDEQDKSDAPRLTRREQLEREGWKNPEMPEQHCGYLLAYLIEMGVADGEGPLSYGEIESWQRQSGIELEAWESRTVRGLSDAYVRESHKARKRDAEPPWADAPYVKLSAAQVALRMQRAIMELTQL